VATTYRNGETIELQLESKKDIATELSKFVDAQTS